MTTDRSKNQEEQEAEADLARAYPMMACGDVQAMRMSWTEARNLTEPQRTQQIRSRLLPTLGRLKTQGTIFGYPLVTDVSSHLESFIQQHNSLEAGDLKMINEHLVALQNILWKRLSGDGGEVGRRILNNLL